MEDRARHGRRAVPRRPRRRRAGDEERRAHHQAAARHRLHRAGDPPADGPGPPDPGLARRLNRRVTPPG